MSSQSSALVVLASEQLWPNIHSLVHWHKRLPRLTDLCVYDTNDERRSKHPALQLKRLCKELYEGSVDVHLPPEPAGIEPVDVTAQLRHWKKTLPGRSWVINATGGLKLMFAGTLDALAAR